MARFGSQLLLFFILSAFLCSCLEARKLHVGAHKQNNKVDPSLFFSSLPKGTVPTSTPSRKEHSTVVDEKLISTERLLLRSVPSPGAGH
ncbi:hypothetical protein AAZX31_15G082700 [Glycine max]|uniref:Uncharacterized protein n=2 Tax=Glycine subgen. Soja TaxID=1462606 RepID=K7MAD2_SOYBN|nr:hypothetical protein JHK87_041713 [Glycine soja]KAH1146251.1 hypothetical protein GYH30_041764 [Glycine max]KHN28637.1 hypothetical protein glysoja_040505 [Glycine soja]KRH11056.1 hypothetical protein GLYMA_15G085800v4 [Glycine max]RZB63702.1 hypothetical protein D0Y65_040341 [Glycine soja]